MSVSLEARIAEWRGYDGFTITNDFIAYLIADRQRLIEELNNEKILSQTLTDELIVRRTAIANLHGHIEKLEKEKP